LVEGAFRFDPKVSFAFTGSAAEWPDGFASKLSATMYLAMYSYFGYYSVCYIGDEVQDPGKTIPRSIFLSIVLLGIVFVGLHLALVGVVPWRDIPTDDEKLADYSLAADFMGRIHGNWAVMAVTLLLIGSCFASAFAGMLGYARIPYAAAKQGHFFS